MIIRPMEPEDADSVAQIEKDSFTQPWSRQGFLDAMRLPENIMLVAQEDGEILGYQCTYVSFDEGELTNIAVKKSARGKGVGAHLIRCLQEKAKESGVERIVLEARVTNEAAISLYQKMGFVNLGIRKNLYEHPVETVSSCPILRRKIYVRRVFTWNSRHDAFAKQMAYGTFAKI